MLNCVPCAHFCPLTKGTFFKPAISLTFLIISIWINRKYVGCYSRIPLKAKKILSFLIAKHIIYKGPSFQHFCWWETQKKTTQKYQGKTETEFWKKKMMKNKLFFLGLTHSICRTFIRKFLHG